MPRFDELDRLVRGADGVLRCMDCGEALDRPEETEKEAEKPKRARKKTTSDPE